MPDENVDVIRSAFAAYLRGDDAAMFALADPDIVTTQFPDQLDVVDFRGHDGLARVMADWTSAWEDWTIELVRAREVGGHVLATAVQRGRGKGSGAPMESEVAFVFALRAGLIIRWQMFHSEEEALEATAAE